MVQAAPLCYRIYWIKHWLSKVWSAVLHKILKPLKTHSECIDITLMTDVANNRPEATWATNTKSTKTEKITGNLINVKTL